MQFSQKPTVALTLGDPAGIGPELIAKLRSVRYYGGLPLDARTLTDEVLTQEGK